MRTRYVSILLAFAVGLTACSDDPTGPQIPDLQGTYDYTAPIDDIDGARWTGTINLFHDGGETFTGSFSVAIAGGGVTSETIHGDLSRGTIQSDGTIHFRLTDIFRHDGQVQGGAITGTWLLTGADQNYSGTFTASRR
jgi:hypothetical protein